MKTGARAERHALCDTLTTLGPDAPTLCDGWDAHDLACHLRLRESALVAASGIFVPLMAGHTAKRMRELKESVDFDQLVQLIRSGPGGLLANRRVDDAVNAVEFFVHHEDLRRAGGFEPIPRILAKSYDDLLWTRALSLAKMQLRRLGVGIMLKRKLAGFATGDEMVVTTGRSLVTVTGEAGELVLWMVGRGDSAIIEVTGDPAAVETVRTARLAF